MENTKEMVPEIIKMFLELPEDKQIRVLGIVEGLVIARE